MSEPTPTPPAAKRQKTGAPPTQRKPAYEFSVDAGVPVIPPELTEMVPKLEEWDPTDKKHKLPPGFLMILEGARRIGKSVFLKWVLQYYKSDFDLALVITETPHNGFWQPIVGNRWVHQGWNPYLIAKLMEEQVKEKKREQDSRGIHKMRKVLLILDDIIGDRNKIHEDSQLSRLAVQGRHFGISVALTTQDPKAISPVLRNNCDVAVIFQQKNWRAKEAIYRDFVNLFQLKNQAIALLNEYTENHDCVVVENYQLSGKAVDVYFHVRGESTYDEKKKKPRAPNYQIGCDEQRRLAQSIQGSLPLFFGL